MMEYFKEYKIISKLNIPDLFSDYYLVFKDSKYYILRIFNQDLKIESEIIENVKDITNDLQKHLCIIYEFDFYEKNYYQILEYPSYGTLTNYIDKKLFSNNKIAKDILDEIIKELVEALIDLHSNGIAVLLFNSDSIFIRNLSKLDLVFVSFNLPPLINEELFFDKLINNYKVFLAPENLNNIFSFESDYYQLGKLIYKIFKKKDYNFNDYESIKFDIDIPIDYKILLLGLLNSEYKKRFYNNELALFLNKDINTLIDKLAFITDIDYPYIKNIPFGNNVYNNYRELYFSFVKSKENFELALKLFFNYLIDKLSLKDYKIFNEINKEIKTKKVAFSVFISVKLEQFYLYNFLVDIKLIKEILKDPKHPLYSFLTNYINYLFNNSFEDYKNSIFYFYSVFSRLSGITLNYLENFFYNIQNLVLDLDFEFYGNYYRIKNKNEIFIKFLSDLVNDKLIIYKDFDVFNTKIDVEVLKDQGRILDLVFLPADYLLKLNSVYILPKEFNNLKEFDFKEYIKLVNWLFKNKSKLIRKSGKNKEKFLSLDLNSYEKIINSNKSKKILDLDKISLNKISIAFISLFLLILVLWFFINNINKLPIFLNKKLNANTNYNTNYNVNSNYNVFKGLYKNNVINSSYSILYDSINLYDSLSLSKIRVFQGNSYDEFYSIYYFNNYYYLLGITNSFGFGRFDTFLVKLDSNLNYISSFCFGNDFDNISYKVLPHLDNLIFIGYSLDSDFNSFSSIFKANSDGKIIYQYNLQELYNSQFVDILKYSSENSLNDKFLLLGTFFNEKFKSGNSFILSLLDNGNSIKNETCKLIYSSFDNQFLFSYFINKQFILIGSINQNNENIAYIKLNTDLNLLKSLKFDYNYPLSLINSVFKNNYIVEIGDIFYQNNLYPIIIIIDPKNDKILNAFYYQIDKSYNNGVNLKFVYSDYFDNFYYILASLYFYNKDKKYFVIKMDKNFDIVDAKVINLVAYLKEDYNKTQFNSILQNILIGKVIYYNKNYDGVLMKFSSSFEEQFNNANLKNLKEILIKKELNINWDSLKIDLIDTKVNLVKSNFSSLGVTFNIYDIK
jgi:hypothetical protein